MRKLNIEKLNPNYFVFELDETHFDNIYELYLGNKEYFEIVPPMVTIDTPKKDMLALPPNKTYEDKYYLGMYEFGLLLCVVDLIIDYPKKGSAFIGLFMIQKVYQNHGIGSEIITNLLKALSMQGVKEVKVGVVEKKPEIKPEIKHSREWEPVKSRRLPSRINNELYTAAIREGAMREASETIRKNQNIMNSLKFLNTQAAIALNKSFFRAEENELKEIGFGI